MYIMQNHYPGYIKIINEKNDKNDQKFCRKNDLNLKQIPQNVNIKKSSSSLVFGIIYILRYQFILRRLATGQPVKAVMKQTLSSSISRNTIIQSRLEKLCTSFETILQISPSISRHTPQEFWHKAGVAMCWKGSLQHCHQ